MDVIHRIWQHPFTGFIDCSVAYNSLSIFFDPQVVHEHYKRSPLSFTTNWLTDLVNQEFPEVDLTSVKEQLVPVCYEAPYSPDLVHVALHCGKTISEIIDIHTSQAYHVFMIGFSPGFPYLGMLPESLKTSRKPSPSIKIAAGSVGIAGLQTGIYPINSPGGWNIIGRTPIRMFDVNDPGVSFFQTGDLVRFSPIDAETFNYLNQYENH
jgi:inhibitor of KinA